MFVFQSQKRKGYETLSPLSNITRWYSVTLLEGRASDNLNHPDLFKQTYISHFIIYPVLSTMKGPQYDSVSSDRTANKKSQRENKEVV